MTDLDFISGEFLDYEIPKSKRYLLKYFRTDLQVAFLRYYLMFSEHRNFNDHTGHYCDRRVKFWMLGRYKQLVKAHAEAKSSLTEEGMKKLEEIEMGRYRLTKS